MSRFVYNPLTGRFDIVGEGGSGGGEGISLVHTPGNSTEQAMSQLGVTRAINSLSVVPVFASIIDDVIKPVAQTSPYSGNDGVVVYSTDRKCFLYKVDTLYYISWTSDSEYNTDTPSALPNKIFKCVEDNQNYVYNDVEEALEKIDIPNKASYDDLLWLMETIVVAVEEAFVKLPEVVVLDWEAMPTVNGTDQYPAPIASGKRGFYRDVFPGGNIILSYQPDTTKVAPYCNSGEMIFRTGDEIPSILSTGEIKWVKEPVFKANSTYVIIIDYTFVDPGNNLTCAMWAEIPNQTE